jgi:hypothetical protein
LTPEVGDDAGNLLAVCFFGRGLIEQTPAYVADTQTVTLAKGANTLNLNFHSVSVVNMINATYDDDGVSPSPGPDAGSVPVTDGGLVSTDAAPPTWEIVEVVGVVPPPICLFACCGNPAAVGWTGSGGILKIVFSTAIAQPSVTVSGRSVTPTPVGGVAPAAEWTVPIPPCIECIHSLEVTATLDGQLDTASAFVC